jgi:hypothetical protein
MEEDNTPYVPVAKKSKKNDLVYCFFAYLWKSLHKHEDVK